MGFPAGDVDGYLNQIGYKAGQRHDAAGRFASTGGSGGFSNSAGSGEQSVNKVVKALDADQPSGQVSDFNLTPVKNGKSSVTHFSSGRNLNKQDTTKVVGLLKRGGVAHEVNSGSSRGTYNVRVSVGNDVSLG